MDPFDKKKQNTTRFQYVVDNRGIVPSLQKSSSTRKVAYALKHCNTGKPATLVLENDWSLSSPLQTGTIVNILGCIPDTNNIFTINNNEGLVIVNPNRLVSVTNIISHSWCERKAAFSEKFRIPSDNMAKLKGVIAHELMGQVMQHDIQCLQRLKSELINVLKIPSILESAYGLSLSQKEYHQLGLSQMELVWSLNISKAFVDTAKTNWKVNSVKDIEDCYWNPQLGMKGKVDCTIEIGKSNFKQQIVPVEFKTGGFHGAEGSSYKAHIDQVHLYTLLMQKSLPINLYSPSGLLVHINAQTVTECNPSLSDFQRLIRDRNQVVTNSPNNVSMFKRLPKITNVNFLEQCSQCEYVNVCGTVLRDQITVPKSNIDERLIESTSHLTDNHRMFFKKWLNILLIEADISEHRFDCSKLWKTTVAEREKSGNCIGHLKLLPTIQKIGCATNILLMSIPIAKSTLIKSSFEKQFIIIGTQAEQCVSFGFVELVDNNVMTITIERDITSRHKKSGTLFTVDKYFSSSANIIPITYLVNMMADTVECEILRSRIINRVKPVFKKMLLNEFSEDETEIIRELNHEQKHVLMASLTTDSFLLVKGFPGTGKTTTIIALLRLLVKRNKSVLLTSFTGSVVDKILVQFEKYGNEFIRIGSAKLNNECLDARSSVNLRRNISSLEEVEKLYDNASVVGTTLLSLKHPIFNRRKFDYCIVSQGCQTLPPVLFGALCCSKMFIIFGDQNQATPIINSKEVRLMEIQSNIFVMYPEPCYCLYLTRQYRMCYTIMELSNQYSKSKGMLSGNEKKECRHVHFSLECLERCFMENENERTKIFWYSMILSSKCENSVIFLDTSNVCAYEASLLFSFHNKIEMDICQSIMKLLVICGTSTSDIGVLTPFSGQVNLFKNRVQGTRYQSIEVLTIEKSQDMEKPVIIILFTRSRHINLGINQFGVLNDAKRLNSAITRAGKKLILVGNSCTLNSYPASQQLLQLIKKSQTHTFNTQELFTDLFR